jgi:hypothetical protein
MNTLRVGDTVEFVTSYPGHEGETVRGKVAHVQTSPAYPCNPDVWAPFGMVTAPESHFRKVDGL